MRRRHGWGRKTGEAHWEIDWPVIWLAVWAGWLALTGCSVVQPVPTLVPTLALATPKTASSPVPTVASPTPTAFATSFATWRTATIQDHQSFDFRQETTGPLTGGDLYYSAFSSRQGTACFWADNMEQTGGRDLGSWSLTELTQRPLPRDRYSGQCIPVIQGHVYVYGMRGDERVAVFRVVDAGADSVTFEYILRK
jgi:hypothetical protein